MAAIPSSYITFNRSWEVGDRGAKKQQIESLITITIPKAVSTAYGDGTATIPASALRLTKIERASVFVDSADNIILAAPSADGTLLYTYDITAATDASRDAVTAMFARVDTNNDGVFKGTVWGY